MKFRSKPVEEHEDVPLADDGQCDALVAHWAARHGGRKESPGDPESRRNHCYVVSVGGREDPAVRSAQLQEILGLVVAQGDVVLGSTSLTRPRPDPRTYIGRGACGQIAEQARACGADMVVIDAELSPSQARNLEDAVGIAICDREGVILNVFLRHARTKKARIQVEIAQLEYLRPRIRGLGLDMDQQAGGMMRARGAGETASELLARQLDGRMVELRKQFDRLVRAGDTQRSGREGTSRIVLVGYTNAGKTSLMNALTSAGLSARDLPFETLDTTSRALSRHGGDVIVSDTVGFIRRLPARLLASFESTLAELKEAHLVVIVVDASDPEWRMHIRTTEEQIGRLGAAAIPRLYAFNKLDRVGTLPGHEILDHVSGGHPWAAISTRDRDAVQRLRATMLAQARHEHTSVRLFVPYAASGVIASAHAHARVLATRAVDRGVVLTVAGESRVLERLQRAAKEARA